MEQDDGSGRGTTLKLEQTTSSAVISKIILLILLGCAAGYFMSQDVASRLKRSEAISLEKCSQEACLDEVIEYKNILDSDQEFTNPVFAIPVMSLSLLILFGTYGLLALLIGLVVRKIIK
ncbi:MAG: hypothetical protein WA865_02975 [Spirulinaceae cyanobacterium]